VIAFCLGVVAGFLWAPLTLPVFVVAAVCWVGLTVSVISRHPDDTALLAEKGYWRKEDLPEEFRFIDHSTTVQQIAEQIGPYKRVRGEAEKIRALEYHLPYGAAVLVFPELPLRSESKVRAVKFFRDRKEITLFLWDYASLRGNA
jgi:hypothetical protein